MAVLVAVALLAALTSDGVDLPGGAPGGPEAPATPAPDPCRAPLPERSVGVAPGSEWKREGKAPGDIREMARLGVRWIRVGFEWAVIEPRRGQFRWDSVDEVVQQAASSCLAVLAMVGTTPNWARRPGCSNLWCQPRDPAEFSRFVTAVAERYGGDGTAIRAWEIWNEENHPSWFRPAPNPERFSRLVVAATGAIREQDPDTTVLLGGLAPTRPGHRRRMLPDRFLAEVYDTGAMDVLDGVAYHPYSFPNLPSERTGSNGFIDQLGDVRDVMVAHGDGDKRIWLTEFGYPTPGGGDAFVRQVEMVVDGFATWRELDYTGPLFWFSWRDPQSDAAGDVHQGYGLRTVDDEAKPAYDVFVRELRR